MEPVVLVTELETAITPFLYGVSLTMEFIIVILLRMSYLVLKEVYARRKQGLFNMLAVYISTNPFQSLDNHIVVTLLATVGMWILRVAITYAWLFLTGKEQEAMFSCETLRAGICGQTAEGTVVGIITIAVLLITFIVSLVKRNITKQTRG